jgi:methionyl aminopeptidase
MIELIPRAQWPQFRNAGAAAAATLDVVGRALRAGMTTADIDALVRTDTEARGGVPSQLGYHGFPAAVCTSVNDVVCHGIPNAHEILRDGDIVNVDVTTLKDGFHGDTSRTFIIGRASDEALHLVHTVERCLTAAIAIVRPGARLGDIGAVIVDMAARAGCSVVRDFGGHGIGREMHMDPHVPHTGKSGRGIRLVAGMAFTIEPMLNLGREEVRVCDDGWRVVTADGALSAQAEHTLLVTDDGAEVLTKRPRTH